MKKKLLAIMLLALCVRVALLVFVYPSWHHGFLEVDLAQNIREGHGISSRIVDDAGTVRYVPTAHDTPGYALLLVFFQWLTASESLLFVQLLQIVIDSLACGVIFIIGRRLFSERVGLIGALAYALYLPEANLAVSPMRDVWVSFGLLAVMPLMLRYLSGGTRWLLASVGACIGVTCYLRPTVLLLPLFLWMPLWIRGRERFFRAAALGVAMQAIALACLLPWGIRNYLAFGKMIFTRTVFYQSLWEGFGEFRNPFGAVLNDEHFHRTMRVEGATGYLGSPEYDQFAKGKVIAAIRERPLWYLGVIARRIPYALLINRLPWGIWQNKDLTYHRNYIGRMEEKGLWDYGKNMWRLNPGFLVTKSFDAVIFLLMIAGIYLSRRQWRSMAVLWIFPMYFVMVHIPIHIEGRYMVPTHWVSLLFASVAVTRFWEWRRRPSAASTRRSHEQLLAR